VVYHGYWLSYRVWLVSLSKQHPLVMPILVIFHSLKCIIGFIKRIKIHFRAHECIIAVIKLTEMFIK
jgi:hypothetical protein